MRNERSFSCLKAQGSALMLILIILGLATALLVSALKSNPQIERDKITADALAKAKDALIGYAVTYRDTHADNVFGYLPLPDLGSSRNGTLEEGNASMNFAGNTKNLTVIGRLPWRTLGLPPLRDGQGECLWYAVSGSFQNTQKADVLNWDSLGHFDAYSSDGTSSGTVSITGINQRPAAIIFSAGAVLSGQNRQTSSTDTVATCGGNYDARSYLDSFNADAIIKNIINYFSGSTNNATGYAYNLTSILDGSQLDATALAAPKPIIFGDISTSLGKIVNDKMLVITADDIFKRIKQRSDFKTDIDTMMTDLAACLNALPADSLPAAAGSKGIDGPLGNATVTACLGTDTKKTNIRNNWKENLLYTKLPTPAKITVNGALTANACNAVLLFGGERTTRTVTPLVAQTRALSTEKSDATMYLEGVNATSFSGSTAYSGTSAYTATTASADIAACITGTEAPGPPPGSDVSFSNNISSFDPAGSGGGSQVTINADGSATLYITGASNKSGCFWFPTAKALYNKTMRAYFKFRFRDIETSTTSSSHGDGITFTVLPGSANVAYVDGMCGDTNKSGYSGSDGGGHAPLPLPTTNLAIEYDVFYNSAYADPSPANKNHIAVLTGSLDHGGMTFSSPCNGTTAGCYPASTPNWLEDNIYHETRIEVFTGCDNTCSTCGASGAYSLVRAWVDCAECRDLNASFTGTPGIQSCISTSSWLNSTTNTVKFGFTSGESSGVRQTIDLSDFGVKFE